MQDIISNWFNDIGIMYSGLLSNFVTNLFSTIFLIIAIRIGYEAITMIFPGAKNLAYAIFKPFRLLHIWFHIQAAKSVNAEAKAKNPDAPNKVHFSVLFSTGMGSQSERSSISMITGLGDELTVKEAVTIAKAPMNPALVMIFFSILAGPLMTEGILIFLHMYILAGVTLVMLPSGHDNLFIFNTILTRTKLSAWYMIFPFVAFALTATIYSLKYELLGVFPSFWWIEPFVMGLYSTWLYLMLLTLVIWRKSRQEDKVVETSDAKPMKMSSKKLYQPELHFLRVHQQQLQLQELSERP